MHRAAWFFVGLLVVSIIGCSDKWTGFVYPNKSNLSHSERIGDFDSIEACRDSADAALERLDARSTGTYQCARGCDGGRKLGDVQICQEVRQ